MYNLAQVKSTPQVNCLQEVLLSHNVCCENGKTLFLFNNKLIANESFIGANFTAGNNLLQQGRADVKQTVQILWAFTITPHRDDKCIFQFLSTFGKQK